MWDNKERVNSNVTLGLRALGNLGYHLIRGMC